MAKMKLKKISKLKKIKFIFLIIIIYLIFAYTIYYSFKNNSKITNEEFIKFILNNGNVYSLHKEGIPKYLNKTLNDLNDDEKKEILGYIGLLNEEDLRSLIWEVLSPINANMIVTTKEIDFLIEKLGKLLSEGINKTLHNID